MRVSRRKAVITSLGVLSPVGLTPHDYWTALLNGTPGVRPLTAFDASPLPCRIAGELIGFDAKKMVPKEARKSLKVMARTVQMGLCAATLAMESGGPPPDSMDPFRFGIEFGCLMVATELDDLVTAAQKTMTDIPRAIDMAVWGHAGQEAVPPLWMLKYLPNMPACHTSIYFNAQGPNNTITAGEAASTLALGEALRVIERDSADYFLVGGTDSRINPLSYTRHSKFLEFTTSNETPSRAVRPFDAGRNGTVLGEGAAVFGLEERSHAEKRGATIHAELAGFASGFDRQLRGDVLSRVIQNALQDAGITPDVVDHVNAHAGGLNKADAFEARAIRAALGDVPVFA
ncbi:MAG: beta-ketoacyl-[acyl-carrier-protein] synthase family protein, partial [Gemmataceae bacterium]